MTTNNRKPHVKKAMPIKEEEAEDHSIEDNTDQSIEEAEDQAIEKQDDDVLSDVFDNEIPTVAKVTEDKKKANKEKQKLDKVVSKLFNLEFPTFAKPVFNLPEQFDPDVSPVKELKCVNRVKCPNSFALNINNKEDNAILEELFDVFIPVINSKFIYNCKETDVISSLKKEHRIDKAKAVIEEVNDAGKFIYLNFDNEIEHRKIKVNDNILVEFASYLKRSIIPKIWKPSSGNLWMSNYYKKYRNIGKNIIEEEQNYYSIMLTNWLHARDRISFALQELKDDLAGDLLNQLTYWSAILNSWPAFYAIVVNPNSINKAFDTAISYLIKQPISAIFVTTVLTPIRSLFINIFIGDKSNPPKLSEYAKHLNSTGVRNAEISFILNKQTKGYALERLSDTSFEDSITRYIRRRIEELVE